MKDARRKMAEEAATKIRQSYKQIESYVSDYYSDDQIESMIVEGAEWADSHPDTSDKEKRKYEPTKHAANYNGDNNNTIGLADGHTKLAVSERLVEKEIENAAMAQARRFYRDDDREFGALYHAFVNTFAHARKSQAAEMAKVRELLERSIEVLKKTEGYMFHLCQPDNGQTFSEWDDIQSALKRDYAALKKEMG